MNLTSRRRLYLFLSPSVITRGWQSHLFISMRLNVSLGAVREVSKDLNVNADLTKNQLIELNRTLDFLEFELNLLAM